MGGGGGGGLILNIFQFSIFVFKILKILKDIILCDQENVTCLMVLFLVIFSVT